MIHLNIGDEAAAAFVKAVEEYGVALGCDTKEDGTRGVIR